MITSLSPSPHFLPDRQKIEQESGESRKENATNQRPLSCSLLSPVFSRLRIRVDTSHSVCGLAIMISPRSSVSPGLTVKSLRTWTPFLSLTVEKSVIR